jgi:hypothetical protein
MSLTRTYLSVHREETFIVFPFKNENQEFVQDSRLTLYKTRSRLYISSTGMTIHGCDVSSCGFNTPQQAFYQYVLGAVRYSYVLVQAVQYQPQGGTRWCSTAAIMVPVQPVLKQY